MATTPRRADPAISLTYPVQPLALSFNKDAGNSALLSGHKSGASVKYFAVSNAAAISPLNTSGRSKEPGTRAHVVRKIEPNRPGLMFLELPTDAHQAIQELL